MSHRYAGSTRDPREAKAIIEAVKASKSYWDYVAHHPDGTIAFSVDIVDDDRFWDVYYFYTTDIVEKTREYSIFHKVKVWFNKKFN